MSEPDRIEAKPEFRSLTESEVDAALMEAASPSPITLEIGRLMVAYVHRYDGSRKGLSSSEILNLTPNCCVPIEARALKLASEIVSDPQLASALQGLIPGMGKDAEGINAI